MLLGDDPLDLLLALGAGFACGSSTPAASSGSVVTLPIMIFLGLDAAILTLVVGLDLPRANAVRAATLVPVALVYVCKIV